MAVATLVSRITGFIRIVLLAAILGAALSSSFTIANQLPNLVAALVLEATFTAIFVPVLARAERDDPDGGAAFVRGWSPWRRRCCWSPRCCRSPGRRCWCG